MLDGEHKSDRRQEFKSLSWTHYEEGGGSGSGSSRSRTVRSSTVREVSGAGQKWTNLDTLEARMTSIVSVLNKAHSATEGKERDDENIVTQVGESRESFPHF